MNLIDDTNMGVKKNNNTKKIMTIIIVLIVILLFIIIGLTAWVFYLRNSMLKVSIDNVSMQTIPTDLFLFEDNTVYCAIKDIASYLDYESYNGDEISEDETKCYVRSTQENAYYEMNSATVYKKMAGNDNNYEYYTMDKEVKMVNGKLYASMDGIEKGFNVQFIYSAEQNQIRILTLPYLTTWYSSRYKNSAIGNSNASFENKKAILYDMLVVTNTDGLYGVINVSQDAQRQEVLGTKYTEVTFVESTMDFIVKTEDDKMGIISYDSTTKITPEYDDVKHIDKNLNLYLVSNDGKYGVVNETGRIILYIEYDKIGVDPNAFSTNTIRNQYLLYDAYIPVMRDQKWGLMDKNGNTVIPIEYDRLGCNVSTSSSSSHNVLLIPEYNAIVIGNAGKYGLADVNGNIIFDCAMDSIYSVTMNGETTYYMTINEQTINLIEFINQYYEQNGGGNNTQETNTTENNTAQNSNQTTEQNNITSEQQNQGQTNSNMQAQQ